MASRHHFSLVDGLLYVDLQKEDPARHQVEPRRLYIPTPVRNRTLCEAHNSVVGGNFGAARTYMAVRQCFFWPGMWKEVQGNLKGCDTYTRVHQQAGKVFSLLNPLPVARRPWERVGVDAIADVPSTFKGNDCIVKFVDHSSKCVYWMPCTKTIDDTEFAPIS